MNATWFYHFYARQDSIGFSMFSSLITVVFGLTASGLFAAQVLAGETLQQNDLFTLRIGAICSLLVAGSGVITAIGGQILGAYKIYSEQRKADMAQQIRYEELLRKMETTLVSSRALEDDMVINKAMTLRTLEEMKGQLHVVGSMLDQQTNHIERKVEQKGEEIKVEVNAQKESS